VVRALDLVGWIIDHEHQTVISDATKIASNQSVFKIFFFIISQFLPGFTLTNFYIFQGGRWSISQLLVSSMSITP
jgi:hypothetical protein